MMNRFNYYNPVKIHFGCGYIENIADIAGSRQALLVTSKGFRKRDTVNKLLRIYPNIVEIIDDVGTNPDFVDLKSYYDKLNFKKFEVILALGGGSVLDTAKVLSVYHQEKSFVEVEKLIKSGHSSQDYLLKPIIAIPTTAGTGSEVTPWATVWDKKLKKKYSLHLPDLWSEACVCDPILTLTLPKDITIHTALDALSHSLESIWNKNSNPISLRYAVAAAKEITEILPLLVNNLDNLSYRETVMFAALNAGLAFSNTQTAIAHGISYYLTANKDIPHGLACSFTLPDIIDSVIGTSKLIDEALINIFDSLSSLKLRKLFRDLGVSTSTSSYGLTEEDIKYIEESLVNNQRANNSLVDVEELFPRLRR